MPAKPTPVPAQERPDLWNLCLAVTERAPLPMATVEGASHILRYVNPAFCRLVDKSMEQLVGKPFCELLPEKDDCLAMLDRVFRTGRPESHMEQQHSESHPVFWSYTMWPVIADERPLGIMIQVTETAQFHEKTVAVNEALILSSLRQQELTEASEAHLQEEIVEHKQADEALREHARLLNLSNDAIIVCDGEDRIIYWNQGAETLYGWSREEALGKVVHVFLQNKFPKHLEQIIAELHQTNHWTGELIQTKRDGQRITVISRWSLDRDKEGRPAGVVAVNTDITERKQAEEALRRAMEFDEAVMTNMGEGLYTVDAQGLVTSMNPAAEELFGWKLEELRGKKMHDITHHRHRDGRSFPAEECAGFQVLRQGKTLTNHEDVFIRKDGTFFDVIYSSSPLCEGDKVTGLVVVFRDVTERKLAEESVAKLAAIVESSEDAIISKDVNGVIASWNRGAERLFGYTAQEAVGQPVTMLLPPDRRDEELGILERIRHGEVVSSCETVHRRKDGTLLDISMTVSPIKNSAGQVIGASKVARDISHRKRNEEALRHAQAQLADRAGQLAQLVAERTAKLQESISELELFSYTITHDMRAPLRAMQGFGALLLSEPGTPLPPKSADYLRRIIDASNRMDGLIQDALQYSKIVNSEIPVAAVEPAPLLRGIFESYPTLQPPHAQIQITDPLPPVLANAAGLAQCFSNLLTNAIKFVKPGITPQIRVWAEIRDPAPVSPSDAQSSNLHAPTVRLWFEDNGIGIPLQYQARIFDMFQQLDKSYEGTGIGLALVRKVSQRMGGKVGVESKPGKGSRFWLEFRKAENTV